MIDWALGSENTFWGHYAITASLQLYCTHTHCWQFLERLSLGMAIMMHKLQQPDLSNQVTGNLAQHSLFGTEESRPLWYSRLTIPHGVPPVISIIAPPSVRCSVRTRHAAHFKLGSSASELPPENKAIICLASSPRVYCNTSDKRVYLNHIVKWCHIQATLEIFHSWPWFLLTLANAPSMAALNGLVGSQGAHRCYIYYPQRGHHNAVTGSDFPDLPLSTLHPSKDEYDQNLHLLKTTGNPMRYKELHLETGSCKPTIFSGITHSFRCPKLFGIDIMHLPALNIPNLFIPL
ncbi:hypothetical protein OE88DRAFT_1649115 [Heliocybe sulcata]|uniref:Uncharacterized protein n=1 Tax=Heliocybe sulcata TaxID=5364 RepID=A0A5C3MJT2_9AGAM|nr:hypothetical protein OE88DRAFT_1649115 [Heliocybe sulcata]